MLPRGASLLDGCTPDRCRYSILATNMLACSEILLFSVFQYFFLMSKHDSKRFVQESFLQIIPVYRFLIFFLMTKHDFKRFVQESFLQIIPAQFLCVCVCSSRFLVRINNFMFLDIHGASFFFPFIQFVLYQWTKCIFYY